MMGTDDSGVGNWIDNGAGAPEKAARIGGLEAQLRLQAKIAAALRKTRIDNGALEIETVEARAVSDHGQVTAIEKTQKNAATDMIEDFMIAANGAVARFLEAHHVSSIRRIVRTAPRRSGTPTRAYHVICGRRGTTAAMLSVRISATRASTGSRRL